MNFARICFSPTEFLNGKSMVARGSTSLKDNVSKCQLPGFRSSPPESAMSAICMGLSGINGKGSLAGVPSWLKGRALLRTVLRFVPCQGPCKLSPPGPADSVRGRGLLTVQSGRVIPPTWHRFELCSNKQTAETQASCCLSLKGLLHALSPSGGRQCAPHPESTCAWKGASSQSRPADSQ